MYMQIYINFDIIILSLYSNVQQEKLTGPVNGDECYFWRTTGCAFGDRCKYKHIQSSKGLDRKPWQKNLYKN